MVTVSNAPQTLIAGDGIIGLSIAVHLASRGAPVTLVGPGLPGAASTASAGMLAPSVERTQGPAQDFGDAARGAWVPLREIVRAIGGPGFDIQRLGILRVAYTDEDALRVQASLRSGDTWLTARDAKARIPLLGDIAGGGLYAGDGVVDAPAAVDALRAAARMTGRVAFVDTHVVAIDPRTARVVARLADGRQLEADVLLIAAGAWSGSIAGLPRPLPIRPLRGAIVALDADAPAFPVYDSGGHAYAFPRAGRLMIGATSDEAGFDAAPRDDDATRLLAAAARMLPSASACRRLGTFAGLRPMTPDALPVLGKDPSAPQIVYACGHGRNGFLEAALTGEVVARLVLGEAAGVDLSPFDPTRFRGGNQ